MGGKKLDKYYDNVVWNDKPRNFLGLPLNFTRYILTEDKLITSKGLLSVQEDEILLYRIVDKSIKISLGERMFGCGTINIYVKDSDTPEKTLKNIKNPRQISKLLDQIINNSKTKHGIHGKDMYGAMGADHSGYIQEIDADKNGIPDVLEK